MYLNIIIKNVFEFFYNVIVLYYISIADNDNFNSLSFGSFWISQTCILYDC